MSLQTGRHTWTSWTNVYVMSDKEVHTSGDFETNHRWESMEFVPCLTSSNWIVFPVREEIRSKVLEKLFPWEKHLGRRCAQGTRFRFLTWQCKKVLGRQTLRASVKSSTLSGSTRLEEVQGFERTTSGVAATLLGVRSRSQQSMEATPGGVCP